MVLHLNLHSLIQNRFLCIRINLLFVLPDSHLRFCSIGRIISPFVNVIVTPCLVGFVPPNLMFQ